MPTAAKSNLRSTIVCCICLATGLQTAAPQNNKALKFEAWNPLCKLTADLDNVNKQAHANLQADITKLAEATRRKLRAQIFLAKHGGNASSDIYAPLMAFVAEKAAQQLAQLPKASTTALAAVQHSAHLQGHLAEFLTLFGSAAVSNGNDHGCLEKSSNARTQAIAGIEQLSQCALKPTDVTAAAQPISTLTPVAYTNLPAATTDAGNLIAVSTSLTCGLTQGADANSGSGGIIANGQNLKSAIPIAAGAFKIGDGALTGINLNAATGLQATAPVYSAVLEKIKTELQPRTASNDYSESATKSSASVKKAFAATYEGTDKPGQNTQGLINTHYNKGNEFETHFWNQILDEKVKKQTPDGSTDGVQLKEIDSIVDLELTLIYYNHLNNVKLREQAKDLQEAKKNVKIVTKTQAEICAGLKEKVPCNENPNCKYNEEKKEDPKCELSEKGKQAAEKTEGKDAKTTNATASNSFVINKAPLLLAVLLF
uniref:Variant surface glycoprotein 601 n=1 Tax=Trypanosoma brucei TaxID=5691 RepID=M4SYH3_9TRYP|nr:variant surface glycoprotein 601 [Trypanosoma brucei]